MTGRWRFAMDKADQLLVPDKPVRWCSCPIPCRRRPRAAAGRRERTDLEPIHPARKRADAHLRRRPRRPIPHAGLRSFDGRADTAERTCFAARRRERRRARVRPAHRLAAGSAGLGLPVSALNLSCTSTTQRPPARLREVERRARLPGRTANCWSSSPTSWPVSQSRAGSTVSIWACTCGTRRAIRWRSNRGRCPRR